MISIGSEVFIVVGSGINHKPQKCTVIEHLVDDIQFFEPEYALEVKDEILNLTYRQQPFKEFEFYNTEAEAQLACDRLNEEQMQRARYLNNKKRIR